MSEITFQDLALADPIQRALKAKGYTTPSPIQAQAIPVLLDGNDLLACAQTGTGKTAAFALPILDGFARNPRKPFRRGVRCQGQGYARPVARAPRDGRVAARVARRKQRGPSALVGRLLHDVARR